MSIQYAILGFLSQSPQTGYDLKKRFAESSVLYWSGNNNQIYRALVALHQAGDVTQSVEHPDVGPSRKVYTITEQGRANLRVWLLSAPELPQLRSPFLVQLTWADQLESAELADLLARYEDELHVKLLMLREQMYRDNGDSPRTPRESVLWQAIADRWLGFHENELVWVRGLRRKMNNRS
jgi:PadR family transcriptional regulator AphA